APTTQAWSRSKGSRDNLLHRFKIWLSLKASSLLRQITASAGDGRIMQFALKCSLDWYRFSASQLVMCMQQQRSCAAILKSILSNKGCGFKSGTQM
ncbi:hypothetical protein Tco_1116008, partial [Tanacetum coccineum]